MWITPRAPRTAAAPGLLEALPVRLPADWDKIVEARWRADELKAVRTSVKRGRPFGDAAWVARTAERLNLGFTLRDPGRPPKKREPAVSAGKVDI